MTEDLILEFLRERRALLNFKGLADAAGLNDRTLRDYVDGNRGKRGLSDDTVRRLAHAIEGLRAPWGQQPAPEPASGAVMQPRSES